MLVGSEVRVGNIIRVDGKACRVLFQEVRGTGKFGKTIHLKVKSLEDGRSYEKSVRAEDKVEDIELNRVKMQYLYKDQNEFMFMNTDNYEQFSLTNEIIGQQAVFLKENSEIDILFEGDRALAIDFPKIVELKVTGAPPPVKGVRDSTYKEVELENGLKLLAPQFIKEGDAIRVNVDDMSYRDRINTKSLGGGNPEKEKKT